MKSPEARTSALAPKFCVIKNLQPAAIRKGQNEIGPGGGQRRVIQCPNHPFYHASPLGYGIGIIQGACREYLSVLADLVTDNQRCTGRSYFAETFMLVNYLLH